MRGLVNGPALRSVGPPGTPEGEDEPDAEGRSPAPSREGEVGPSGGGPPPPGPPPPSDGPELPPAAGRFLRRGVLLYPFVAAGLWAFTGLGALDALFLAGLLELLPVLAVAQVPLANSAPVDRTSAYLGSAAAILVVGWLSLWLGGRSVGFEAMGMATMPWGELAVWTLAGLGGGLALVGVSQLLESRFGVEESDFLKQIIPRTTREKTLFAGVSLAAGLGEELAYRAYAIPVLAGLLGSSWSAAVLTSGIFGFLHAYQGTVGVVRTGCMGLVLAAVFLLSGSVWPAILAHVAIDLVGGLVLGPRLLDER